MLVGSRVVRGPDWDEEDDQDGGEGFVGTITSTRNFQDGSALPKGTVLVYWDIGFQGCYRAGQGGCYDLRILDSAPAGIKFLSYSCHGCNQASIPGKRWQCTVCPNYNLCTLCYMNDIHDSNHRFMRFDLSNDSANGVDVGIRSTCLKTLAKGIFPSAIVKTGNDWTSEPLANGIVLELDSWEDIPRSAAMVHWDNFCPLLLRVGHEGKVDLELVTSSLGPLYYKDHLPTVCLDNTTSLKNQLFSSPIKQGQQDMEPTVLNNQNTGQQKALQQELIQHLPKCQQSDKTPPPRTLPKPSARSRKNNSSNSNVLDQSKARNGQEDTKEPSNKVMDIAKRMSQADVDDPSAERKSVKYKAPAPPTPANREDLSETTLRKTSKKTRPAPPPPRPRSELVARFENISPEVEIKEAKAAPPRTKVASLAASLSNLIQLGPTKARTQTNKPPAREVICMTCDEKASKVFFEPCGHSVNAACIGCASKLKRCLKCNELIEKRTTADGSQLAEPNSTTDTSHNEKLKEMERKLAEANRELECPICMDEQWNIVFDCGHKTCVECSDNILQEMNNQCPTCKQIITERKRIY